MAYQILLMTTLLARVTYAWPITPLDGYSRTQIEDVPLKCGDYIEYSEKTFAQLNITFENEGIIPTDCQITLRINIKDEGIQNFGLRARGYVDIQDARNSRNCASSYVSVADEDVLDDELGSLEKYCGNITFDFHTTEDILVIELTVGRNGATGSGFQMLVEPHFLCGGQITINDFVTTPDFPQPYPRDINCFWVVKGPEDQEIVIKCHEFDLEKPKKSRCTDSLQIIGGPVNEIYCGNSLQNKRIRIPSNTAFLDFRTNDVVNVHTGMNCSIKFVQKTKDLLLAKFFK
ncbi:dorsal-ventral patterning protein tolloid-like [Palaemon carinicauda]|uniref:dorsal-ventral patterning protein tolloid-like n=1 Tax=Palaemon carinicauda TaxID=392227 RepID=UPI0035B657B3